MKGKAFICRFLYITFNESYKGTNKRILSGSKHSAHNKKFIHEVLSVISVRLEYDISVWLSAPWLFWFVHSLRIWPFQQTELFFLFLMRTRPLQSDPHDLQPRIYIWSITVFTEVIFSQSCLQSREHMTQGRLWSLPSILYLQDLQ